MNVMNYAATDLRGHGGLRRMALSLYLEILEKMYKQNLEDMIISSLVM